MFKENEGVNMHEKNLNSWEEFEEQLKQLENDRLKLKCEAEYIYRGQEKKSYGLKTTLERHMDRCISLKEYYELILRASYEIQSFSEDNLNIPSKSEFEKWIQKWDSFMENAFGWSEDFQRIYSYMVYLRHYGFPSPLLDWSSSPYVAAYFAFRNVLQRNEDVSIYVYLESKSGIKIGGNEPYIVLMGPFVKIDQRHFIQHSKYTMCINRDTTPDGEWRYALHEDVFNRCDQNQDILWKFSIPFTERLKVLKLLDRHNVNALSLFRSKESLMETMALQQIHFGAGKKRPPPLVPKLQLGNPIFRQSSSFALNPENPMGNLTFAKLELGGQVRSQAGAWERGEYEILLIKTSFW